jgi:hypothetical protein
MKPCSVRTLSAFVLVSVALADGLPAAAQSGGGPRCHTAVARSITKYQAALFEALGDCHVARNAGEVPLATDCNDAVSGDLEGKVPRTAEKSVRRIARACRNEPADALDLYARCPTPVADADDAGETTGIDDAAELSACLLALTDAYMEQMAREIFGNPSALPDEAQRTCQAAIARSATRVIEAAARARNRCQRLQQRDQGELAYDACAGAAGDPDGRISGALAELEEAIDESCNFSDGHDLGACGFDAASLRVCVVGRVVGPLANGLVAAAQQLPGTCAPVAEITVNSGGGPKLAATRLDLGYSGSAHRMDLVDGFRFAVGLANCDEDCEGCEVSFDRESGNCRCQNDSTIECSTISGPDAACGGGTCRCSLGPPRPQNDTFLPACFIDRVTGPFEGSTAAAGQFEVAMQVNAQFHIGSLTRPCPTCDQDPVANDGVREGTCHGGARNFLPCDRNGTHATFGSTSLDCMPSPGALLDFPHLRRIVVTSGASELTASITDPSFCEGEACHCSLCSGDVSLGCSTNADCASAGAGTCGIDLAAANPSQNECTGGAANCVDGGDGNATCSAGPVDRFCDGLTEPNGRGLLQCASNADCNANDCNADNVATSGECGTCSLEVNRSCFGPTVSATGTPGVFHAQAAAVFCVPRYGTSSPSLTNFPGYPGPGRLKVDFDIDLYCADRTTRFELPGGSNCP